MILAASGYWSKILLTNFGGDGIFKNLNSGDIQFSQMFYIDEHLCMLCRKPFISLSHLPNVAPLPKKKRNTSLTDKVDWSDHIDLGVLFLFKT